MLTIAKVTNDKGGYEVFNDFCIIRDAKKYQIGKLYICKILNRFTDKNGNDHFVVVPISEPITGTNYNDAAKIVSMGEDEAQDYFDGLLNTAV